LDAVEQESAQGPDVRRAPFKQVASWSTRWFALRADLSKAREVREKLTIFAERHAGLLRALGYTLAQAQHEFVAGSPLPLWVTLGDRHKAPQLVVVPAYNPGQDDDDLLDQTASAG
jgi:hypothetical protein